MSCTRAETVSSLAVIVVVAAAVQGQALDILLADNGSGGIDVIPRLSGLGHNVIVQSAGSWSSSFDYTLYDVVAFEFSSTDPADITNLVNEVDAGTVGVVFLRGYGAEATAQALGLISGQQLDWQTPTDLDIIDNTHPITLGLPLGAMNLGFTYMTNVIQVDPITTTTLGTGPANPALVVHNTRRAVIIPYYGHSDMHGAETPASIAITERALQWAANSSAAIPTVRVVTAAPAVVTLGSGGNLVSVSVENVGVTAFDVSAVTLHFRDASLVDRGADYLVTPSPTNPTSVSAGAVENFDFDVSVEVAAAIGSITIDASCDGIDQISMQVVSDPEADTPDAWDVVTCALTSCGDCNGDSVVSILDALVAAQHAAGLLVLVGAQFSNCNVFGVVEPAAGAAVDILDALGLAQAAAGLPVSLICC